MPAMTDVSTKLDVDGVTLDLVVVRLGKTPAERQPEVRAWIADIIRCFPTR